MRGFLRSKRGDRTLRDHVAVALLDHFAALGITLRELPATPPAAKEDLEQVKAFAKFHELPLIKWRKTIDAADQKQQCRRPCNDGVTSSSVVATAHGRGNEASRD